jgi:hypothetical protein
VCEWLEFDVANRNLNRLAVVMSGNGRKSRLKRRRVAYISNKGLGVARAKSSWNLFLQDMKGKMFVHHRRRLRSKTSTWRMDLLAYKFSMLSDEALACYAAMAKQSKYASSEARKYQLHLLKRDAAKEIAPLVKESVPDAAVVVCRSDEVASCGSVVGSVRSDPNRSVVFIDPSSGVLTFWSIDDFQLGSGVFGKCRAVREEFVGDTLCTPFAVDSENSEHARSKLHKELSAMDRMNHPNVMRAFCLSLAAEKTAQALLLPLASGNLWCWLRGLSVPTSAVAEKGLDCQRKACLLQIVHGLAHMHSRAVLHLDLKPDNVLWDGLAKAPTFRIADFGNCRRPDEELTADQVNSELYRPVELFHMGNSRVHALCRYDVWAYGCMVFDIAQQHPGLRHEAGIIQPLFGQVDMKSDAVSVWCIRNYRIMTYAHSSVQNLILLAQPLEMVGRDQLLASCLVLDVGRVRTCDCGDGR